MTKVFMKFVLKSIHLEKKTQNQQIKILLLIFKVTLIILKYLF